MISELKSHLSSAGIAHKIVGDDIHVALPNNFGTLEIAMLEGDESIVGLVGYDWDTHGDLLAHGSERSEAEAICDFIRGIFEGQNFLVERIKNGATIDKYVEDDRESIGKYIEADEEERICNEP